LIIKSKKSFVSFVGLILLTVIITGLIAGCTSTPVNQAADSASINTFYDIPGITEEETRAIEILLQSKDSFSFGALLSTYAFVLPDGSKAGFFSLLAELLEELFGVPFNIEFYDWDVLNENLNDFTIDFTAELTPTPERRLRYFMTEAIAELSLSAFINVDTTELTTAESLNGLKVGFWSESITEGYILMAYPDLVFESVAMDTDAEVAEKLFTGEIDAFVTPTVDAYVFKDFPFIVNREIFPFVYAVSSMTTLNPELAPIITAIDKYMSAGEGFYRIHDLHVEGRRAFSAYSLALSLTDYEKDYLGNLLGSGGKVPILMESSLYPVTFYNEADDEYQGIAQDILHEVSLLTGIEFEVKNDIHASWQDLLDMLSDGEAAMIADLWHSDEQQDRFLLSEVPYLKSNYAFISKIDTPYTDFLIPILRTGVVKGTVFETVYHRLFPDGGNLYLYDSNSDALNALESDDIDLLLTTDFLLLFQTNYREKSGYKINILLNYLTGESFFGFNSEMEHLNSIISKAQRFIDTERIALSWTGRVFDFERRLADERADNANILAIILALSIGGLLVLLTILAMLLRKNRVMIYKLRSTSGKLEEALVETNAASKAKSDFLSNMSHEIRTPLNAIVGMTTIGKKADNMDDKDRAMKEIENASSHLLGVINDVLDMAKIEAGKLEIIPVSFMFEKMLQKVLSTIYYKANEKEHNVIINVDDEIPRFITADEQRLSQVIINLLTNAVKFTPDGGTINFDASVSEKTDDYLILRIEVADSGIGISKDQQEKLFDAFEQANTGTTREYGGTGLGLAIVKRIVEMMGGEIWVESDLGRGAVFIFTAQVTYGYDDESLSENKKPESSGAFEGKYMLVVEDVELNSRILAALLEDTGLILKCVENGLEAIEEVEAYPDKYDIIFMDLQMPKMNGLEATRHIRKMPGHSRDKLPIVAMTANVFKDDIDNCIDAGMDDHLSKPLDIEVVMQKLHKYLDK